MSLQDRLTVVFIIVTLLTGVGGSVLGAIIGAKTARSLLHDQIMASREERVAIESLGCKTALRALQVELRLNAANRLAAPLSGIHAPFSREAFVAALPYLGTLPATVYAVIQDADRIIVLYNTVVTHANLIGGAGRPQGTFSASLDLDATLVDTARDAYPLLNKAAQSLDGYLAHV